MTRNEILNIIASEQAGNEALNKISNPTALSVKEQLNQTFARSAEILFDRLDLAKQELQLIADAAPWATEGWYINMSKQFRYGQDLLVNEYTQYYYDNTGLTAEDIAAMRVVKQTALELNNKTLIMKVVGEDENGELIPLPDGTGETEDIFTKFKAYMNLVKRPGTPITFYNFPADSVQLEYDIYYDGLQVKGKVEAACVLAVDNYIKNIMFNGFFSITELTDVLQKVKGVRDGYFKSAKHKRYFDSEFAAFERRLRAYSGYYVIDTLTLNMKVF